MLKKLAIALTILSFGTVGMSSTAFADKKAKAPKSKALNAKKGPKNQERVWIKGKDGKFTPHDCKNSVGRVLDDDACHRLCNRQYDHQCYKDSNGRIMKPADQAPAAQDKTKSKRK